MAKPSLRLVFICFVLSLATPLFSHAGLGEKATAVDTDRVALKALKSVTNNENYSVHELVSANTTVREYSNADGVVFAVTWIGIKRPDLSQLFASYYSEYDREDTKQQKSSLQRGRRTTLVKTDRLVVERGGHMRALHGRAYVRDLVPSGVDPETLE